MAKSEISPVFVLGTTRSGTSAVQLALLSSQRYRGGGEGHVSPLLLHLFNAVETFWAGAQNAVNAEAEVAHLSRDDVLDEIFRLVQSLYKGLYGNYDFAEKTPTIDAIRVAPLLHSVWPNVKVIFCRRRGLENVFSKCRKFPAEDFGNLCSEWSDCMLEWKRVRDCVPSYLELDQIDMAHNPDSFAKQIASYLSLSETEAGSLRDYFSKKFPERSSAEYVPLVFDEMKWSEEQKGIFKEVCSATMDAYGYSYDEGYWGRAPL